MLFRSQKREERRLQQHTQDASGDGHESLPSSLGKRLCVRILQRKEMRMPEKDSRNADGGCAVDWSWLAS